MKSINSKGEVIITDASFRVSHLHYISLSKSDWNIGFKTQKARAKFFKKYFNAPKKRDLLEYEIFENNN